MDFYKNLPDFKLVGSTKEGGMFQKGNIDVTIQSPWMNTKTGKMIKDTVISIVKRNE